MYDIGLLYAIVAAIGILVVAILLNRVKSTEYKETIDLRFCHLLTFIIIFCFVDMIWGFLTAQIILNRTLYVIFTYGFHLCAALSAYFWAGYVFYYLQMPKNTLRVMNTVRTIFIICQFSLTFSNIWTKSFFIVDEDAIYHSYALRNVMFVLQFAYYAIIVVYSLIWLLKKKTEGELTRKYKSAIVFSVILMLFGIAQMKLPFGPMYSLGFMVTGVALYSFNITFQREQFLAKMWKQKNDKLSNLIRGLSGDFQAAYYVDLETGEYEQFENAAFYKENVSEKITNTNDFFADTYRNIDGIIFPDDYSIIKKYISREGIIMELATKQSFSFNYRIMYRSGYRYFMIKVVRPDDYIDSHKVMIGIFDDDERVSALRKQNEQLERAISAAEVANKAKSQFLFNMSHDVRTPLNAILGFADLARKHSDDKKYLDDCLEKLCTSGEHLLALINDVLDMSRIESGKLEISETPASISKQNEYICNIARELAADRSIQFIGNTLNLRDEYLYMDILHTNQVLINVLSNAVKYTNPGGEVTFRVEQLEDKDEEYATFRFTVIDNGIGMSEEFVSRIFEEFAREKNSTMSGIEGTGLGMSIVKNLVDLMRGTIEIQSKPDEGTTVIIVLDFRKATEEAVLNAEREDNPEVEVDFEEVTGKRILLVDDNLFNREIAKDMLEEYGFVIEEAGDGTEAFAMVTDADAGYYDLVLMDIQMPIMNGYEATFAIRSLPDKDKANVPIVALTANAFEEDKENAINCGMNGHLAKPVRVEELNRIIVELLGKYNPRG